MRRTNFVASKNIDLFVYILLPCRSQSLFSPIDKIIMLHVKLTSHKLYKRRSMMDYSLILDEKEQKMRQYWLWATAIRAILLPAAGWVLNLISLVRNNPGPLDSKTVITNWFGLLAILASGVVWLYIIRRCAYQKPGTKILNFLIVVAILSFLFYPMWFLFKKIELNIFMGIDSVIWMCWLYLAVQMRKINKKIQSKLNAPDKLCCE